MSYDHKIIDQKFHLKGLVDSKICDELIDFYKGKEHMTILENSWKFNKDRRLNAQEYDRF